METAAHHRPIYRARLPTADHRRPKPKNVRAHVDVGLPMRRTSDLTLRRVSANTIINIFNNRLQDPRPFCAHAHNKKSMADEVTSKTPPDPEAIKNKKESEEESKQKLPPPPEKPLPGDCCGSGCVRCVWDLYYEELEDYNNLCESDSKPKSTTS
ncbi:UPF0651 protein P31B10.02, mitochondrial [Corylus avellana]|uniref:UPF0651 protein P31B10.02, mitochondrial n=1 Tax=Corylus avellana TaxID=13451 RepID=UPI001E1EE2F9|nr:UPF0651 protein P31B10.02, mitochondrial [Corylus avellana]